MPIFLAADPATGGRVLAFRRQAIICHCRIRRRPPQESGPHRPDTTSQTRKDRAMDILGANPAPAPAAAPGGDAVKDVALPTFMQDENGRASGWERGLPYVL